MDGVPPGGVGGFPGVVGCPGLPVSAASTQPSIIHFRFTMESTAQRTVAVTRAIGTVVTTDEQTSAAIRAMAM